MIKHPEPAVIVIAIGAILYLAPGADNPLQVMGLIVIFTGVVLLGFALADSMSRRREEELRRAQRQHGDPVDPTRPPG